MKPQEGGAIVDLGNVIIAHRLNKVSPEKYHLFPYNSIPAIPGVFEGLKHLNKRFKGNVSVVFNSKNTSVRRIYGWLRHHKFTTRTGIPLKRAQRSMRGRDKTPYMNQSSPTYRGTTLVVDDRLEVLSKFVRNALKKKIPKNKFPMLFLFSPQSQEVEQFKRTGALRYVHVVHTWQEIIDMI